jgi:hypothetical protein
MKHKFNGWYIVMFLLTGFLAACSDKNDITLSCNEDNDLYLTLLDNRIDCIRYMTPDEAVSNAPEGSAVMILADGYPGKTTVTDSLLFRKAADKRLRLYIEYPSYLPGVQTGATRGTQWERAVISSDAFAPEISKHRILAVHDCRFIPMETQNPDIVIARVAGFDSAIYGLPEKTYPLLFEKPYHNGQGGMLIATTKFSQFLTARYAPAVCWKAIWGHILEWLLPGKRLPVLKWTTIVRPRCTRGETLPHDYEKQALKSGIDWFFNSGLILHPSMLDQYNKPANPPDPSVADPDLSQDWPYGHRINKLPQKIQTGDGTLGIMEGYDSKIFYDGSQAIRWWNRGDCNAETAGAMGLAGFAFKDQKYLQTSSNIGDWLFSRSMISLGDRANPAHPAYGLSGWNDSPEYCGPGTMDGFAVYYGDDNARVILGMMMTAVAQNTTRYDKRILNIILGNLRVSGIYGFQPNRINQDRLEERGWESYFTDKNTSFSPHYQANMWACYLWAYEQTGFELFFERARKAIGMTMEAYPGKWEWTNGIQQERAKMLLPLAWLVRIEDTPLHRRWLRTMADDLLARQDKCGAIPEEIGETGKGGFPPPASNEAYGTSETPLIQSNNNKASDLLYTLDFAFIGLHEAAAATGEKYFSNAEDRLAEFLCRIQIRSEKHSELDGGWFRAFDFNRWEYWASNGDAGWGAWSIETGWTQSWITAVLSLRQMGKSLWEITHDSKIEEHFINLRKEMLPDKILNKLN